MCLLKTFLVILGKAHVPQELGVNPLKTFIISRLPDVFPALFAGLVMCGMVFGLGQVWHANPQLLKRLEPGTKTKFYFSDHGGCASLNTKQFFLRVEIRE